MTIKNIPAQMDEETGCITTDKNVVWENQYGSIPNNQSVRCTCGNKKCLCIHHMELDDGAPGRKLTAEQVQEIRRRYHGAEDKHGLQAKMAKQYGVSPTTIRRLLKGYNYKKLDF